MYLSETIEKNPLPFEIIAHCPEKLLLHFKIVLLYLLSSDLRQNQCYSVSNMSPFVFYSKQFKENSRSQKLPRVHPKYFRHLFHVLYLPANKTKLIGSILWRYPIAENVPLSYLPFQQVNQTPEFVNQKKGYISCFVLSSSKRWSQLIRTLSINYWEPAEVMRKVKCPWTPTRHTPTNIIPSPWFMNVFFLASMSMQELRRLEKWTARAAKFFICKVFRGKCSKEEMD